MRSHFLPIFLAGLVVTLAAGASAQTYSGVSTFPEIWRVDNAGTRITGTGTNNIAFDLTHRTGTYHHGVEGPRLVTGGTAATTRILDTNGEVAAEDALFDRSDLAGAPTGFDAHAVESSDDGMLYVAGWYTSGSTAQLAQYASLTASPTLSTYTAVGHQGRAMDVYGSGSGTVVIIGTTTTEVAILTTLDGSSFTKTGFLAVSSDSAENGIAAWDDGSQRIVVNDSTGSHFPTLYTAGAQDGTWNMNGAISVFGGSGLETAMLGSRRILAEYLFDEDAHDAGDAEGALIWDITDLASPALLGICPLMDPAQTNTITTGGIGFDPVNRIAYVFGTNQGYGAFDLSSVPVELSAFGLD